MTEKKNFYAIPLKPGDLIQYQEGSVVSRMLIYEKAGTLSIFAFAAGQGLSEHTAPYDAIIQVLEGNANITIGEAEFLVNQGEMIILPAKIPHSIHAVSDFKMMLTMIHE
jgi:quercetin dioxygenase-like cupin family protein